MRFDGLLAAARRHWWIAPTSFAVGVAASVLYLVLVPALTTVTVEAKVIIDSETSDPVDIARSVSAAHAVAVETAALGSSDAVLREVAARVDSATGAADIAERSEAVSPPASGIIRVRVANESGPVAEEIATELLDVLAQRAEARNERVTAEVVQPAGALPRSVSPGVGQALAVGALLGLGLGLCALWARVLWSPRVEVPSDAESATGTRVLGVVRPGYKGLGDVKVIAKLIEVLASKKSAGRATVIVSPDENEVSADVIDALTEMGGNVVVFESPLVDAPPNSLTEIEGRPVVLVVVGGRTMKRSLENAADLVTTAGGEVVGTVLSVRDRRVGRVV